MAEDERRLASLGFLGGEFLSWLYLTLHRRSNEALTWGHGTKLRMVPSAGTGGTTLTLSGASIDSAEEAFDALRRGAQVEVIRLVLLAPSGAYSFNLDASGYVSSLVLPSLTTDPDEDAPADPAAPRPTPPGPGDVFDLRMSAIEVVDAAIDSLLTAFLAVRLEPETWARERKVILSLTET